MSVWINGVAENEKKAAKNGEGQKNPKSKKESPKTETTNEEKKD